LSSWYDETTRDEKGLVMRLADKTAVITGGGSGLGREGALLFAREGANVVVIDRAPGRAEAVAKQIVADGGNARHIEGDVGVEADISRAVDLAVSEFGQLDIMWANAGHHMLSMGATPIDELTQEEWADLANTNLDGVIWSCKYAVPALKAAGGGSILITGSASAIRAYPGAHIYAASKGATNALGVTLARELGRFNIRVNSINPMFGMSVNFMLPRDAEVVGLSYEASAGDWDPMPHAAPLKSPHAPQLRDHAYYALFLVSDEARWVSGQCISTGDGATANNVAMNFDEGWMDELVSGVDQP
jgi:NAD(P)-dependent dehydrogenase (short-subunit alcohol dehydrogenase family)